MKRLKSATPMFDVRAVLAQKERQLERVRREIVALVRVIPLLEEKESAAPVAVVGMEKRPAAPSRNDSPDRGMGELELYYPFVGRRMERH
jgi:hypothetical protein